MSRAAVNRYAAIVLLLIAVVSAVALKLSLSSHVADVNVQVLVGQLLIEDTSDRSIADVESYKFL